MARSRGIQTIVDGAHAFAHFPFKLSDLECDYYGTSLHKWLLAPVGTGFLYMRREHIEHVWPLTPAAVSLDEEHPEVRGDRHASGGRTTTRSPKRSASTSRSASSGRRRACSYLKNRWARRLEKQPGIEDPVELRSESVLGPRHLQPRRRRPEQGARLPLVALPDHRRADSPPGVDRHARDAEHLHDARRGRHVLGRDRSAREEPGGHGVAEAQRITEARRRSTTETQRRRGDRPQRRRGTEKTNWMQRV